MFEQMLAAATTTSGTGAVGAATRPLDGRALTHGVDARAGEGAGSSAIFFHRAPWVPFLLCWLAVSTCFWWRIQGASSQRKRYGAWLRVFFS
jgi:hypothetical protein